MLDPSAAPIDPAGEGPVRLWVDDLRPAPEGWGWVKTSRAALTVLATRSVTEMSLDHDLGGDDTTRPVVLWLCEHPDRWPAVVRVHSANPVGVEWLTGMITRYAPRAPATEVRRSNRTTPDQRSAR